MCQDRLSSSLWASDVWWRASFGAVATGEETCGQNRAAGSDACADSRGWHPGLFDVAASRLEFSFMGDGDSNPPGVGTPGFIMSPLRGSDPALWVMGIQILPGLAPRALSCRRFAARIRNAAIPMGHTGQEGVGSNARIWSTSMSCVPEVLGKTQLRLEKNVRVRSSYAP